MQLLTAITLENPTAVRDGTAAMADSLALRTERLPTDHRRLIDTILCVSDTEDSSTVTAVIHAIRQAIRSVRRETGVRLHDRLACWVKAPVEKSWKHVCCSVHDIGRHGFNLQQQGIMAVICSTDPYDMTLAKGLPEQLVGLTGEEREQRRAEYLGSWGETWHAVVVYLTRHPATDRRTLVVFDPSDRPLPGGEGSVRLREIGGTSMVQQWLNRVVRKRGAAPEDMYVVHQENVKGDCLSMCLLWMYFVGTRLAQDAHYHPIDETEEAARWRKIDL